MSPCVRPIWGALLCFFLELVGPAVLIGDYIIYDGLPAENEPRTYTCQEVCAVLFGGKDSDFRCSTRNTQIDGQAYVEIKGSGNDHACEYPFDDDFKLNDYYADLGSVSAWVSDYSNCEGVKNYCFSSSEGCRSEPPNWIDAINDDCWTYEFFNWCGLDSNVNYADSGGITADTACCECEGGVSTAANAEVTEWIFVTNDAGQTWDYAEFDCVSKGGHLVSIHNEVENAHAGRLCKEAAIRCWIGLMDITGDSHYTWTDGSLHVFNNDNGHAGSTKKCFALDARDPQLGWIDQNCERDRTDAWICSIPLQPEDGLSETTPEEPPEETPKETPEETPEETPIMGPTIVPQGCPVCESVPTPVPTDDCFCETTEEEECEVCEICGCESQADIIEDHILFTDELQQASIDGLQASLTEIYDLIEIEDWMPPLVPRKCHELRVISQEMTNWSATKYCRELGGELASVHDGLDNAAAAAVCSQRRGSPKWCWLGLSSQNFSAGDPFLWSDGSHFNFENWEFEDPNCENCTAADCVQIKDTGKWHDLGCGQLEAFLCSVPLEDPEECGLGCTCV